MDNAEKYTCTYDSKIFFPPYLLLQHRAKVHEKIIASNARDGSFIPSAGVAHASTTVWNGDKLGVSGASRAHSTSKAVAAVDAHSSAAKVPAQPQRPATNSSSVLSDVWHCCTAYVHIHITPVSPSATLAFAPWQCVTHSLKQALKCTSIIEGPHTSWDTKAKEAAEKAEAERKAKEAQTVKAKAAAEAKAKAEAEVVIYFAHAH